MIRDWRGIHERPEHWCITPDPTHPYRRGAVFLGLAGNRCHHSLRFHDSSLYGSHGTLTNMEPSSDWLWDATLGRRVLAWNGIHAKIPITCTLPSFSLSWWGSNAFDSTSYKGLFGIAPTYASLVVYGNLANLVYLVGTGFEARKLWSVGDQTQIAHYVFSQDGAGASQRVELWKNGVSLGAANVTTVACGGTLNIGNFSPSINTLSFLGRLGDVCIHSRALSPSEIAQLADPSNVMLSGLMLPPLRKLWRVAPAAAAGRFPLELMGAY